MKKKTIHQPSSLEILRKTTLYPSQRFAFGLPFYIAGILVWLGGGLTVVTGAASSAGGFVLAFGFALIPGVVGMFLFSVPSLASAIFDMADAAIRADARESARDAKVAHEAYRKMESGGF